MHSTTVCLSVALLFCLISFHFICGFCLFVFQPVFVARIVMNFPIMVKNVRFCKFIYARTHARAKRIRIHIYISSLVAWYYNYATVNATRGATLSNCILPRPLAFQITDTSNLRHASHPLVPSIALRTHTRRIAALFLFIPASLASRKII